MYRHVSLLSLSVLAAPSILFAANFNPSTSADLQTALTTAAASSEDDTIALQAGTTYFTNDNANATFVYNAADGGSLTIVGAGADSSVLDGNSARPVLQILSAGADDSVEISGVGIQNGQGGNAAGIDIVIQGNLQFHDNILIDNHGGASAGGGYLASNGTSTLVDVRDNEVRGNTGSFVSGLGMGGINGATLTLEGNTIADNQNNSAFAGGVQIQSNGDSAITVRNNVISGNSGSFANGIQVQQNGLNTIVFEGNTVQDNVNPLCTYGGAQIQNNQNGDITVIGNTIEGNSGSGSNGIRLQNNGNGIIVFESNTVANNDNPLASEGGASLGSNGNGEIQVANNVVYDNSAGLRGGGINVSAAAETINVVNNTVFGNSVEDSTGVGGGIYIGTGSNTLEINLFNNILYSNSAVAADSGADLLVILDGATVQLFNNDFTQSCFGMASPFNCDPATVAGLSQGGNIDTDPLFVDSANGDFQLQADSPAIDAGDLSAPGLPALDFAGNPRVVNGQVDIGAFEAQPALSVDPLALDFGSVDVGSEKSLALTLSNNGSVALVVSGFAPSSGDYSVDTEGGAKPCGSLPLTIEVGASCTVEVVFGPASEGVSDATLAIDSENPEAIEVALTGTGQAVNAGQLSGGGCSLGHGAFIGRGLVYALLIPISAVALFFRRRRK